MSPGRRIALLFAAGAIACSAHKDPTPREVSSRYHALLDSLDADSPGASVSTLEAFAGEYAHYQIADSARLEMKRLRAESEGRYHEARELARDGEFDLAERMLEDLARIPETDDGASAVRHLEFEFYIEKARWLLVRQRFEESEAVARVLLMRDLTRFQRDQAEQILDYTGNAGAAMGMSNRAKTESACRQLIVFLANVYVNDGRYPESLSLPDLERLDPYTSKSITSTLASIDDYHATQDNYSLVAVGKDGHRFKVVDGNIEE